MPMYALRWCESIIHRPTFPIAAPLLSSRHWMDGEERGRWIRLALPLDVLGQASSQTHRPERPHVGQGRMLGVRRELEQRLNIITPLLAQPDQTTLQHEAIQRQPAPEGERVSAALTRLRMQRTWWAIGSDSATPPTKCSR
jgi:hypothetical protein